MVSPAQMRVAGENEKALPRKINFTVATLQALPIPDGKQSLVYDVKTKGLVLLTTPNRKKLFYFYRKIEGRPEKLPIGEFPAISIENARNKADSYNGDIAKGLNPAKLRRQTQMVGTFGELWEKFLENHAKPKKRSWKSDEHRYKKYLEKWQGRKLADITCQDVQAMHSKLGKDHPTGANRVAALLSVMFNKAKGLIGYEGSNPTEGLERFREKSRERFLQADELPKFFKALEAVDTPDIWQDYFKILLLTGARRANVCAMKWAHLNLDKAEWHISAAEFKTDSPMTVHLPDEAVKILTARKDNGSEWVFPANSKSGHVVEPRKQWEGLLTRSGLSDLRMHDLRRTLGSWQAATGASLPVIGKSLGHKHQSTTQIYARLNIDPVRESVNKATAAMMKAVTAKPKKKK